MGNQPIRKLKRLIRLKQAESGHCTGPLAPKALTTGTTHSRAKIHRYKLALNSLRNTILLLRLKGVCVHLDGRKDKMNRGAAAVYLHGISAFKHKHKNNTIKLPWWAICYCNILLSAPAALLCFERTTERKMETVSLVPSVLPVFPYSPFLSLSTAAKRQSFSLRWWMSDLQ